MTDTEWSWAENTGQKWLTPEPYIYYLAHRWLEKDYLTVLDHGCGLGRHSIFLSRQGFVVTAFDQSAAGLEKTALSAARAGAALRTVKGDMGAVPLPDGAFDAIVCHNVIYHATFDDVKRAAKELARVIRPGGELYITMCSKSSPKFINAKGEKLDACTVMTSEQDIGNCVAHCYLDYSEVLEVFNDFDFALPPREEVEYEDGLAKNAHWVLLFVRK